MERFIQRKKDVLSKKDKSSIKGWDKKISKLCDKINSLDNYYTTSSCSGRITLVQNEKKKSPDAFEFVSHEKVNFKKFNKVLPKLKNEIRFKQESFILHIVCKDLGYAKKVLEISKKAGLRRAGAISLGKNIVIELIGSDRIEFPLMKKSKLLVERDFLKIIIKKGNENLKKSWETIQKLEKLFAI